MTTPSFALNFTTATLDPRVTVTRTGSTATVTRDSGLLEVVAADTPRFDYDSITLACKGLLIEESRSNLLSYSEDFTDVTWSPSAFTVTANTATGPFGGFLGAMWPESIGQRKLKLPSHRASNLWTKYHNPSLTHSLAVLLPPWGGLRDKSGMQSKSFERTLHACGKSFHPATCQRMNFISSQLRSSRSLIASKTRLTPRKTRSKDHGND